MDVCFEFDASSLDGSTLVAFETLMKDGKTVAEHVDLEDPEQTVFVEKTPRDHPADARLSKTGDGKAAIALALAAAATVSAIAAVAVARKRSNLRR